MTSVFNNARRLMKQNQQKNKEQRINMSKEKEILERNESLVAAAVARNEAIAQAEKTLDAAQAAYQLAKLKYERADLERAKESPHFNVETYLMAVEELEKRIQDAEKVVNS